MDLLRFITSGSVDDGKSTLIGRLLYDSKSILSDQLEAIEARGRTKGIQGPDLALLTDGLRAEREQGITIDVAYKYFSTAKRKFIIADAPGHVQYTRNMITGASTADAIIVLIDARAGITEQTRRHSIIASLLRIKNIVVAINKMDLVEYDQNRFNEICEEYNKLSGQLNLSRPTYIPISALSGDNIVDKSPNMDWYLGASILKILEDIPPTISTETLPFRMMVQQVIRPQSADHIDFRGYAGKIMSGKISVGDKVRVLPLDVHVTIKSIIHGGIPKEFSNAPHCVTVELNEDVDISRGDLFASGNMPNLTNEFTALGCWMSEKPLRAGTRFLLQHQSKLVRCIVQEIEYRLDVATLDRMPQPEQATLNDLVKLHIKTQTPISFDPFEEHRDTGTAILVDETTHQTACALMLS